MSIWAVYSRGQDHRLTYTETLYCGATSNTLVVLFLRPTGAWWWVGGRIKGSRVPLSKKFHYPIDTDLPPSQRSLVLYVSTFLSHWKSVFSVSLLLFCFCTLRSRQLQRSALSLAEGIIALLQMEEKVWYWYSSVGVRRWGVSFPIQYGIAIHLKNRVNCFAWEARKFIRHTRVKVRMSSHLVKGGITAAIDKTLMWKHINPKLLFQQIKVPLRLAQI